MTITVSDMQREAKVTYLKQRIIQHADSRDKNNANLQALLAELASLLGLEVCGEALVEKAPAQPYLASEVPA